MKRLRRSIRSRITQLLVLILLGMLLMPLRTESVQASRGDLFSGFGGNGIVETEFLTFSTLSTIGVHSSGRIYALGSTSSFSHGDPSGIAIARYLSNGTLDPAYDQDGKLNLGGPMVVLPGQPDYVINYYGVDMLVQSNEQLVLLADRIPRRGIELAQKALIRLKPDATLDSNFGWNYFTWPSGSFQRGGAIVSEPDGDIVICGHNEDGLWLSRRLANDGSLDSSFGTGGYASFSAVDATCADVVVDPDGRLVIAGWVAQNPRNLILVRFHTNGVFDSSFGFNGQVVTSAQPYCNGNDCDEGASLRVQPNGMYVIAATTTIERYTTSGGRAIVFGNLGVVEMLDGGIHLARDLVVAPDGSILVAGKKPHTSEVFVRNYDWRGNIDTGFGNGGERVIPVLEEAFALAIRSDGRLLVGGRTLQIQYPGWIKFALAVLDTDYDPWGCYPVVTGNRHGIGGTTHAMAYDGDLTTFFDSSHDNWQYIEIDFNCVQTFYAVRRFMSRDGSDTSGSRNREGETVSYSLDGVNWTELTLKFCPKLRGWHSVSPPRFWAKIRGCRRNRAVDPG